MAVRRPRPDSAPLPAGGPAFRRNGKMPKSRDEIFAQIQSTLVDALGVDEDEVTENATLTDDLGAESIDFLDIVFRLEKAFSIKIPRGELFPDEIVNNPEYVEDGTFTGAGLQRLKKAMPHADFVEFEKHPAVDNMQSLFTVRSIVNNIERKEAQPD
jgi:acyl carrier protein